MELGGTANNEGDKSSRNHFPLPPTGGEDTTREVLESNIFRSTLGSLGRNRGAVVWGGTRA